MFTVSQRAVPDFEDNPPSSFSKAINLMSLRGLTAGCSTSPYLYCPKNWITRAQMAVFVARALAGLDFSYSQLPWFQDVPPGDPYFKYVQKQRELGGDLECSATQYCPGWVMTRADAAYVMIKARGNFYPMSMTPYFQDVPANHLYFWQIQKLYELGITAGCGGGRYCPDDPLTREQAAMFIMRGFFGEVLP